MKGFLFVIVAYVLVGGFVAAHDALAETQTVCAGPVPPGWIKIDDRWDPAMCGNPTSIIYNVWTIERYDDKPKGAVMTVCSGDAPFGWSIIARKWDPAKCGKPTSMSNNLMTMKRLN